MEKGNFSELFVKKEILERAGKALKRLIFEEKSISLEEGVEIYNGFVKGTLGEETLKELEKEV